MNKFLSHPFLLYFVHWPHWVLVAAQAFSSHDCKGYSCFPVWMLTSSSSSFLYAFLPLKHRCLWPYFSQIPGAQKRPRYLALSYVWVERDCMKSRKGEVNLGQTVWEDRTEEEVLGLRTLSCLVFQGFEELTHNTPCRRLELVMG